MHKRTGNIQWRSKNIRWKQTHNRATIGALCLKQSQMKLDIPASNGFILGTCLWSWIEKNICTQSWNDYCKNRHQRPWHVSNIRNWLKQRLKSPIIWGSKSRHRLNKKWLHIEKSKWLQDQNDPHDIEKAFDLKANMLH